MSIKPEYLTLDALLQKRLFRIPQYQRTYSWEAHQRKDLFRDLEKLSKQENGRRHFMSTIVCLKTGAYEEVGTDEYDVLDVVDGQQRLTTLIVLLKAISLALGDGHGPHKAEGTKIDELLAKRDQSLILLQTNHQSSLMFRNYLLDGAIPDPDSAKTLAEQNLRDAFVECRDFVEQWKAAGDTLTLLKLIKNRLDFIFYVLEDEGAVYTVFEVLNSRGLAVDSLDKCKSMLMGIIFERLQKDQAREQMLELHKCWESLYSTLGVRVVPGHEVLRFAATLWRPARVSKPLSESEALDAFRDDCQHQPANTLDVSRKLLTVAKALERLYGDRRRRAVTTISHSRLLAVAILSATHLKPAERNSLLGSWERVTFRIYGLFRRDARTAVGDYTRLAHEVINSDLSKTQIEDRIELIGRAYPIEHAIDAVKGEDHYNGWEDELRYLLYRYEEFLAAEDDVELDEPSWHEIWKATASTTIEHIFPQTPSAAWHGKVKRPDKYLNRLGNLMVLPPKLNKKAGNQGFQEKKPIYQASRLRMVEAVLKQPDWTNSTIENRETVLLEWIKQEFAER